MKRDGSRPVLRRVPSDIPGRLRGERVSPSYGAGPPGAPGAPGRPQAPPLGRTMAVPVPWATKPAGAREINIDAFGGGFNAAASPALIPGSVFQLPADNVGVLRSITLNVNAMLTTSLLEWRFLFDGNPVEGWSNVSMFPRNAGYAGSAYGPDETFIDIPAGAIISVQIIVDPADANTYQAGVTYHGWSYPKRLADRFATLYQF